MDYRKKEELIQKYKEGFFLMYRTIPMSSGTESENRKNFNRTKEALAEVGVDLNLDEDGILSIELLPEKYVTIRTRTAGRRKSAVLKTDGGKDRFYTYSNIIPLMNTKSDKEIILQTGMKKTTYYRHKKKMMESELYQNMDKERWNEEEYMEEYFKRYDPLF